MELTALSKIKFNNKYYQIFSDIKGNRYFYLIDNNEYKKVDLQTNIKLAKIFNNSFDGKLYIKDKTIINAITICSVGLGVITLCGIHEIGKLYRDYLYKDIMYSTNSKGVTYDEIIPYIDEEKDLDKILENNEYIDDMYYSYIKSYVSMYEETDDLTLFYHNLEDMKIKEVNKNKMIRLSGEKCAGYYDIISNEVIICADVNMNEYKEVLYHEFRHATKSTSVIEDGKLYYNVFNDNGYGTAFLEGMNSKYTDYINPCIATYPIQQTYINMFIDIFGEEKLKEIEMYGNADTLIKELANITGTEVEAKRLIMLMDDELNASSNNIEISMETSKEIKRVIASYFLASEQKKLLNSNENNYKLNYVNYINNCNRFKLSFNDYARISSIVYNYCNYNGDLENEEITNWFNGMKYLYAKDFLEKYSIDEEEIEELNSLIYVGEVIDYISDNNMNVKCYVNDYDTYNLYMNKAYLLYGDKEELMKYLSEDTIDELRKNAKQKSR